MDTGGVIRAIILRVCTRIFLKVAVCAIPSIVTVACVAVHQINTLARQCYDSVPGEMNTRCGSTLVHVSFTVFTAVTGCTLAEIAIAVVRACTFMSTWKTCTLVNVLLTVFTRPTVDALTHVGVD